MTDTDGVPTPNQLRTQAATAASVQSARKRRIARLKAALEKEGFVVTLAPME